MMRYIIFTILISVAFSLSNDSGEGPMYCEECLEITVTSSGGASIHQPQTLGRYTRSGSLWENMIPFWVSETNDIYIIPDPNSNPILYYMRWLVTGAETDLMMKDAYTGGIICPYDVSGEWMYRREDSWYVDPTLNFECTKISQSE